MSAKLLVHRAALANIVRRIALAAGEIILDHYDEGGFHGAVQKGDGSPVTQADREAEAYIVAELYKVVPDVPVVGEELVADGQCPDLTGAEYIWLVDALDGTREFIEGGDEFTVNIALLKQGVPVLGVVYAPVKGELYAGCTEEDGTTKALRWLEETGSEKDIRTRAMPRQGMTVMVSKTRNDGAALDTFLEQFKVEKQIRRASSLKLCAIAAGKADLYPKFAETCAWDIAAGHAILSAAGGTVMAADGGPMRYCLDDPAFRNGHFVASGADIGEIA